MYSRVVEGEPLSFGVTGKLWRNAFLMYDRETESEWLHFTGEAVSGPHRGKRLEIASAVPRIAWKDWRARHPDTLVLSVRGREEPASGRAGESVHGSCLHSTSWRPHADA